MTKSELIERIALRQAQLSTKDVELAVKCVIDQMVSGLAAGKRIEIRGFGSFSLHYRAADGSPRKSAAILSTSSSRNTGFLVPAFFIIWMTWPGNAPM